LDRHDEEERRRVFVVVESSGARTHTQKTLPVVRYIAETRNLVSLMSPTKHRHFQCGKTSYLPELVVKRKMITEIIFSCPEVILQNFKSIREELVLPLGKPYMTAFKTFDADCVGEAPSSFSATVGCSGSSRILLDADA